MLKNSLNKKILTLSLLITFSLAGCSTATNPLPPENTNSSTPTAEAPTGTTATATVSIKGFKFLSADLTVKAGTTVTWTNDDSAPHTVTSNDSMLDSDDLLQGDTFSYTFMTPGTYEYFCAIHPAMKATITVQ